MADYVLINGDKAMFMPAFGAATVVVQPGTLVASGPATFGGSKKLCIVGDEKSVKVPGCMYTAGPYSIPGTGMLEIAALAADQKAEKTKSGATAVMLVGGNFDAKFTVQAPAQQPTAAGPVPDGTPTYQGKGNFVTTNSKFRGV
jgi:hypothetical protein